jgi:hypothetical protein
MFHPPRENPVSDSKGIGEINEPANLLTRYVAKRRQLAKINRPKTPFIHRGSKESVFD